MIQLRCLTHFIVAITCFIGIYLMYVVLVFFSFLTLCKHSIVQVQHNSFSSLHWMGRGIMIRSFLFISFLLFVFLIVMNSSEVIKQNTHFKRLHRHVECVINFKTSWDRFMMFGQIKPEKNCFFYLVVYRLCSIFFFGLFPLLKGEMSLSFLFFFG